MAKQRKRYCIEKLIDYDPKTKLEKWKLTNYCDDRVHILETMFLAPNTRIYDTIEKREVRRNVDLDEWTRFNRDK